MKDKIIIANWKMSLSLDETRKLASEFKQEFDSKKWQNKNGDIVVCPNFISLTEVGKIFKDSCVNLGAQNVFWEEKGSYTSSVSPSMACDAGCRYVLIGHSEVRKYLLENYAMIHKKVKAVLKHDLIPVICIGENWDERKTNKRDFVLVEQLQTSLNSIKLIGDQRVIVAYEPIWAIGSGTAIEPAEAEYAHKIIRLELNNMFGIQTVSNNFRIIYGGSISSDNVASFMELDNIDGSIIGGASLKIEEFSKIAKIILDI